MLEYNMIAMIDLPTFKQFPFSENTKDTQKAQGYYRPQRSCGQGNIFTPVCHSFCSQGGCLPQCMLGYPPPGPGTPHGPAPLEQTPPRDQTPPTGNRLQHTVNERPVRILLECILVTISNLYQPNSIVVFNSSYFRMFHANL